MTSADFDLTSLLGDRPPMPADPRKLPRPRVNSWLDKRARRMAEIMAEDHGLVGFDPDMAYLIFAEEIRRTRASVAEAMGDSETSVQKYITDESLRRIVAKVAAGLAEEKPGTDPFADEETVRIPVAVWARALWSLQIAALSTHAFSEDYSLSMMRIATSMSAVLAHSLDETPGPVFNAPHGGAAYVARTCDAAADQVEAWDCPVDGLRTEQLVGGLRQDAELVAKVIAASAG